MENIKVLKHQHENSRKWKLLVSKMTYILFIVLNEKVLFNTIVI